MQRLTAVQLAEWAEYLDLEPSGFEVDDVRFGVLCSLLSAIGGVQRAAEDFAIRPRKAESDAEDDLAERLKQALGYKPPEPAPAADDRASTVEPKLFSDG